MSDEQTQLYAGKPGESGATYEEPMENYVLFVQDRELPMATFPAKDDDDARKKVNKIIESRDSKNLYDYMLFKGVPLSEKASGAAAVAKSYGEPTDNQQGRT